MKKSILLLSLLFCFLLGFGQIEFAPPGAVWYYTHVSSSFEGTHFNGYQRLSYDRDTLINGLLAKVIKRKVGGMKDSIIEEGYLPEKIIYQDSQKVYAWANEKFFKIYDFGLEAGDTVQLAGGNTYFDSCFTIFKVDSVTYNEINGIALRNIHLDQIGGMNASYSIINEKMGAIPYYLFEAETSCVLDYSTYSYFRCYEDNNFAHYQYDTTACDHYENVSALTDLADLKIQINPNPIHQFFQIQNENPEPYDMQIFNLSGQMIHQIFGVRESSLTIDCQAWPPGTYIATITIGKQRAYKKIVKLP